jgi:hypothetical protein
MIHCMNATQPADTDAKPRAWSTALEKVAAPWRNMPAWRKWLMIAAAAAVGVYLSWRGTVTYVLPEENQPAGEKIVAALEAHKRATGKFPPKLGELEPKFLAKLPRPVPDTNFVYAATSDGSGFWFGYQTNRDNLAEYDSRTRKWEYVEYEDSYVLRQRGKEFVKGPSS